MSLGLVAIVAAHAAALGLVALAVHRARRRRAASARRGYARVVALAVALALVGLSAWAWIIEPETLVVREVSVSSPAFEGAPLRIAALGDIHVGGPHMSLSRLASVVSRVNALDADLVVLLGDYVHGHAPPSARTEEERAEVVRGIAELGGLRGRLGVFAVLGNHDVWYDRGLVRGAFEAASIEVLENAHAVVHREGGERDLLIVGLEDATTQTPDYAAALAGAPEGLDRIVLSHSPDPFDVSPPGIALTLAAHTHCGQVRVPFLGRPMAPTRFGERFVCGLVVERGEPLFVTAGLGTSILPVRFLTPPEIALVTLRHGD
ncbi:MAG: metallophosphoesterase [Polyangiaceae bacterium]